MATTEIATIDKGAYLALNHDFAEVTGVIADNLGGEQLTERDLLRVQMPAGGGTTWEVPVGGELTPMQEITGVLVHFKLTRAYWPQDAEQGSPPACSAVGPEHIAVGIGDPGGACASCPMHQWGTRVDDKGELGKGRACQDRELWFLLLEGSFLPLVVSLPPTSLDAASKYRKGALASTGTHYTSVVTGLALEKVSNGSNHYSVVKIRQVGRLDPEEAARAKAYADGLRPMLEVAAQAMATEGRDEPAGA